MWVSVSECRNENTAVTHTTHLKTHQGTADGGWLSPTDLTAEETGRESEQTWHYRGLKIQKPLTLIHINCNLSSDESSDGKS